MGGTFHNNESVLVGWLFRKFSLNAAVEVEVEGEHYVHAAVFHKFSSGPQQPLQLVARARQFSSFVLMVCA